MKALNEAYRVLHDDEARSKYDLQRRRPVGDAPAIYVKPAVREVGIYGQLLSALLCLLLGLMLLLLVRFNGLWFFWAPLNSGSGRDPVWSPHGAGLPAMTSARASLRRSHPARRFRAAQEVIFWSAVCGAGYGVYLILTLI